MVDEVGGSSPSAVPALVMAYKYFGDSHYLDAARRVIDYMDREIISMSDYFSSPWMQIVKTRKPLYMLPLHYIIWHW